MRSHGLVCGISCGPISSEIMDQLADLRVLCNLHKNVADMDVKDFLEAIDPTIEFFDYDP